MIVRYALKCETCEQPHTIRIGVGLESAQIHKFPCRRCSEEIVLRMDLDHVKHGWRVICVENCAPIHEVAGAPIVNVDANFLIPADEQHADMSFSRIMQIHAMHEAQKAGSLVDMSQIPPAARNARPYRRPDYAEEWTLLQKAWSLARNHQAELSNKRIAEASAELYPQEPIGNLQNWVWRFATFVCQPTYEQIFRDAMETIQSLKESELLPAFAETYNTMAEERGTRYFTVLRDFYAAYPEFGQVYFYIVRGMPLPASYNTTSTDFDAVKMFYGNTYEHFTTLVEYLALINNMLASRGHDAFQTLTLDQYRKLDKPQRFGPFSLNAEFMALCTEADNQIRNASHHGSFVFHQASQTIRYRSGKGGTGPEQQMSYANYLERCVRLFLQTMTLFRIELVVSHWLEVRLPL
jgi:hypothetical protein